MKAGRRRFEAEHDVDVPAQNVDPTAPMISAEVPVSAFIVKNVRYFWYVLLAILAMLLAILALTWADLSSDNQPPQVQNQEPINPAADAVRLPSLVINDELADERGNVSVKSEMLKAAISRFSLHEIKADISAVDLADYIFSIRDENDDLMQLSVVARETRNVVWSGTISISGDDPNADTFASALTLLLPADGVLYTDMATRNRASALMVCLRMTQAYFGDQTLDKLNQALGCHEGLSSGASKSALSLADQASLYVSGYIRRFESINMTPSDALVLVEEALELAPSNAYVHRAHSSVLSAMGEREVALLSMAEAYRFNPQNLNIAASYGYALYRAKQFEQARDIMLLATNNYSLALPWWHHTLFLAAAAIDDQDAMIAAGRALTASTVKSHIAARVVAAQLAGDRRALSNALGAAAISGTIAPLNYYTNRLSPVAAERLAQILQQANYPVSTIR